jgi:hypothetical protein
VEGRPNEEMIAGALIKQMRVREMNGILTYPEWDIYEYTAGEGIVTFDPVTQMKTAEADSVQTELPDADEDA